MKQNNLAIKEMKNNFIVENINLNTLRNASKEGIYGHILFISYQI